MDNPITTYSPHLHCFQSKSAKSPRKKAKGGRKSTSAAPTSEDDDGGEQAREEPGLSELMSSPSWSEGGSQHQVRNYND